MATDFAQVGSANFRKHAYQLLSQRAVEGLLYKEGTVKGVAVLAYGQGDCNAIIDQNSKPVIFFDMGGGKHLGSRSHPWHNAWGDSNKDWRQKVPNLDLEPTVLLSHWDGDHYSTAWYMANKGKSKETGNRTVPDCPHDVKKLRWLAPRQCKHPSKLEFVLDLEDRLKCWPEDTKTHTFKLTGGTSLIVNKCTPPSGAYDPNLDGLAVVLERHDTNGPVERMVLPGDAPYDIIPSCQGDPADPKKRLDKVCLLLAYHHGSKTHLTEKAKQKIPAPLSGGTIAYTFGLKSGGGRCYGHPSPEAIEAYAAVGWKETLIPAGGKQGSNPFKGWPPEDSDEGKTDGGGDVFKEFAMKDKALAQGIVVSPKPIIALRRSSSMP